MRVIKEMSLPECKITIYLWNQKYLLKFERGVCEQTYKISQLDVPQIEMLEAKLTPRFIEGVVKRFDEMHASLMADNGM